jgi:hypothetical protein
MNLKEIFPNGILVLAVFSALSLFWSLTAYAETTVERQQERQTARDVRQEGRETARLC